MNTSPESLLSWSDSGLEPPMHILILSKNIWLVMLNQKGYFASEIPLIMKLNLDINLYFISIYHCFIILFLIMKIMKKYVYSQC